MTFDFDNNKVLRYIPNVVRHVQGEVSLYDKIAPWLQDAANWLEQHLLGSFEPEGATLDLVEKIIVRKAFVEAAPSLDLSLTPSGFAVISAEGRVPASKERIERLVESLNSSVDAMCCSLISELAKNEEWLRSDAAQYYTSVFILDFSPVLRFREKPGDIFEVFERVYELGSQLIFELERRYLGHDLVAELQSLNTPNRLFGIIGMAVIAYADRYFKNKKPHHPSPHEIWHIAEPILARLPEYPDLYDIWKDEMGDVVNCKPFENKSRGAFYF